MLTLLAYVRAPRAFRGNKVLKKSNAALLCLALIADTLPPSWSWPSSGVKGGVGRSDGGARGIAIGAETPIG